MSSRNKIDLNFILVFAYGKAILEYQSKYPSRPVPFLTCTYRSPAEQDQLFKQVPVVTHAKGLESPHNYNPSLAFDIAFITLAKQLDWSAINFKNFADIILKIEPLIEWGGGWKSFTDRPHFQLKNWRKYIV